MEIEHSFIATDGLRLHTVQAGPTDGPPLLLLHGFPEFGRGWDKQIEPLAKAGYRVIVPDQRGYNLSDKPRGVRAYGVDRLVADVLGLVETLGYQKFNLVGHDWGAVVAWALALWHPDRLSKLVILNVPHPAVMLRFLKRDREQLRRSWYVFFFQLPWLPEAVFRAGNFRGGARMLRGSGKLHTFTSQDVAAYKQAWSQPGALTGMINWYRALFRHRPQLPRDLHVHVPTLMLWGQQDVALSHRMAEPSIDICDDGQLIFFENASHWVQHDEAEAVTSQLLDFLRPDG
jgi:pimeloyl-ACP methyl ester carboxylesterase